jgi:hypothetical protein
MSNKIAQPHETRRLSELHLLDLAELARARRHSPLYAYPREVRPGVWQVIEVDYEHHTGRFNSIAEAWAWINQEEGRKVCEKHTDILCICPG